MMLHLLAVLCSILPIIFIEHFGMYLAHSGGLPLLLLFFAPGTLIVVYFLHGLSEVASFAVGCGLNFLFYECLFMWMRRRHCRQEQG